MRTRSVASQLKEIENLWKEVREILREGIAPSLKATRRMKNKKAIRILLNLRQRCKGVLVRLKQVERVIKKGGKKP